MANVVKQSENTYTNSKIGRNEYMLSKMLNNIDSWKDCVLAARELEFNGDSGTAVSLLRAAERKFPDNLPGLHKKLFELMRRQKIS